MTSDMTEHAAKVVISGVTSTLSTPTFREGLSGSQRALIRALDERDPSLSAIYQGGIAVLQNTSNPDRFSQCAHSMRELMDKLPEWLDVPTKAQKENLKTKVRGLEDDYMTAQQNTQCFSEANGWGGNIDVPLKKCLAQIGSFFQWFDSHHPRRRDEIHNALDRLDGSGRALPEPLASLNVDAWESKKRFFLSVAHHGHKTDEPELRQWLDALEQFLLDKLIPRTFDDFTEIDALLEEGGKDAKR